MFTAGPTNYDTNDIDRIVATDRMLSIENVQREHIGTYSCEVANKYGKKWSFPIELDVERPGEIREVRLVVTSPEGEESEILTNQYEWIPNAASDEHDEKVKSTDNKQIYNFEAEKWEEIYWNAATELWYREEDNTPYQAEEIPPERGDTWEDADEPGTITDDGGYRV